MITNEEKEAIDTLRKFVGQIDRMEEGSSMQHDLFREAVEASSKLELLTNKSEIEIISNGLHSLLCNKTHLADERGVPSNCGFYYSQEVEGKWLERAEKFILASKYFTDATMNLGVVGDMMYDIGRLNKVQLDLLKEAILTVSV